MDFLLTACFELLALVSLSWWLRTYLDAEQPWQRLGLLNGTIIFELVPI